MKSVQSRGNFHVFSLVPWLIVIGAGCVDLTPAWEKPGRDLAANRTGGMPSTGGSSKGEMGGFGSGGIFGNVENEDGETILNGSGGSQHSGGTIETGGQSGIATGGMGSGGIATGGMGSGGIATGGMGSGGIATGGMGSGGMALGGASGGSMGGTSGSQSCATEGKLDSEICWYFGALGDSCAMTCKSRGGTSPKTASHIGSLAQGGSAANCARLLSAFGNNYTLVKATRADALGFGCHVYPADPRHPYWLSFPNYTDTVKSTDVRMICGCLR